MRDSVFGNVVFEEYTKKFLDKSNNDFFHIVEQTALILNILLNI